MNPSCHGSDDAGLHRVNVGHSAADHYFLRSGSSGLLVDMGWPERCPDWPHSHLGQGYVGCLKVTA